MAKVIATCPNASLFDDGTFCCAPLALDDDFDTSTYPRAGLALNPPGYNGPGGLLTTAWKWATALWIDNDMRAALTVVTDDPHEQTSETCPVCGRNKNIGKKCWWCGA